MSLNHSPDLYVAERLRYGKFACDICGGEFPITHLMRQSGLNVGSRCCWEPDGGTLERDLRRQLATRMAARLSAIELAPPDRNGSPYYGVEEVDPTPTVLASIDPNPIILQLPGGDDPPYQTAAVILTGVNFSATDVILYDSPGIINRTGPTLISDTIWQLDLAPDVVAPPIPGKYGLTFNGTYWRNVFDIRTNN